MIAVVGAGAIGGLLAAELVAAGRPLEHDLLTGAVVRAAERHGIDVPLNRAILALLQGLDESIRSSPRRVSP